MRSYFFISWAHVLIIGKDVLWKEPVRQMMQELPMMLYFSVCSYYRDSNTDLKTQGGLGIGRAAFWGLLPSRSITKR